MGVFTVIYCVLPAVLKLSSHTDATADWEFDSEAVTLPGPRKPSDRQHCEKTEGYQESRVAGYSPSSLPKEPEPHQFLSKGGNRRSLSSFIDKRRTNSFKEDSLPLGELAKRRGLCSSGREFLYGKMIPSMSSLLAYLPFGNAKTPVEEPPAMENALQGPTESLRSRIQAGMVFKGNRELSRFRFVPNSTVQKLICEESVEEALEKHKQFSKSEVKKIASFVCKEAPRLFAILAWMEAEIEIVRFYEYRFGDKKLPVEVKAEGDWIAAYTIGSTRRDIIKDHPFSRQEWTERNVEHFCEQDQWQFLSPVFYKDQFRYDFPEETRLPFMDAHALSQKDSNFSVVEERRIHRDHLQMQGLVSLPDDPNQHPRVAVKELKRPQDMDLKKFEGLIKREIDALEVVRNMDHRHRHLIKALAYYTKGRCHYVLFPWADQGSLRDYWGKHRPVLDEAYLEWAFTQMSGLASALERLHFSDKTRAWRHGDIKPENILCFEDLSESANSNADPTILVIADVGLAKGHEFATGDRVGRTDTNIGTLMYEPPETELHPEKPRSRRYDVWSMGCIYLEFIIWLLYRAQGLNRFLEDIKGHDRTPKFYALETQDTQNFHGGGIKTARLNAEVQKWIDSIRKDSRCPDSTALRSLLELVVTRLLVTDVSRTPSFEASSPKRKDSFLQQSSESSSHPSVPGILVRQATKDLSGDSEDCLIPNRASSKEMDFELQEILKKVSSKELEWIKWDAHVPSIPGQFGDHLDPSSANVTLRPDNKQNEYRFTPLDDNWERTPDTEIIQKIFADGALGTNLLRNVKPSVLCDRCRGLKVWLPDCTFSDTPANLKSNSTLCNLCRLISLRISSRALRDDESIRFFRMGSGLACSGSLGQSLVSLYTTTAHSAPRNFSSDVQNGFPRLPDAASATHIKVLAEWIRSCDRTHQCYPTNEYFLPTRVLDVGDHSSSHIRIFCGTRGQTQPGKYIALSHRWGSPKEHRKFCLYKRNIEQFRRGITIADLPKTFQDAIHVTRELGVQFLWIDSLCIIQDDPQDWDTESRMMETVFSSAYLTLAASCADGTEDGFLKPRPQREVVTLSKNDGKGTRYYLCDVIDDFGHDVDQGELNKRGWVLQERALSRRTIYFTQNQTYWECGGGVRCETLTKMKNRKASFLGDPDFPSSVSSYVKGTRIELFQSLYEKYSNLDLTYHFDRPVAIKGLERRLIRTLGTVGGFGVFECYLHRCLLWRRASDTMHRIPPETLRGGQAIPSWSWMAYSGGIRYLDAPFGGVNWRYDLRSPFRLQGRGFWEDDERPAGVLPHLEAPVWDMTTAVDHAGQQLSMDIFLDEPDRDIASAALKCVVAGTDTEARPDGRKRSYCLFVIFKGDWAEHKIYERVGVGILDEGQIVKDAPNAGTVGLIR